MGIACVELRAAPPPFLLSIHPSLNRQRKNCFSGLLDDRFIASARSLGGSSLRPCLQVRDARPGYPEPSRETLKTLSSGFSEARALLVLTRSSVSLTFCRARVLSPQGPVPPPAEFSHCALPSFMNSMSALCLGSVPALVRTTAQKPSAVSGEAFLSSHPQPRLLSLALCAVHRMEEKDKVDWGRGGCHLQT